MNPFIIAGHVVYLLPPNVGSITIKVPWPKSHMPDQGQQMHVMNTANGVLKYMVREAIIPHNSGMTINVITDHKR